MYIDEWILWKKSKTFADLFLACIRIRIHSIWYVDSVRIYAVQGSFY